MSNALQQLIDSIKEVKDLELSSELLFDMPINACDCHHHIYDDRFSNEQTKNSMAATAPQTVDHYIAFKKETGITRNIITAMSTEGFDNNSTIKYLEQFGKKNTKAIIAVDGSVTDEELKRYDELGARGVRMWSRYPHNLKDIVTVSEKIKKYNWHIDYMPVSGAEVIEMLPVLESLPVPVVFDHHAMISCRESNYQYAMDAVTSLMKNNQAYVKLSGYTYCADPSAKYEDTRKMNESFLNANEDNCLWGSDWPNSIFDTAGMSLHKQLQGYTDKQYGFLFILLNQLTKAPFDDALRKKILVDNPEKLYRF